MTLLLYVNDNAIELPLDATLAQLKQEINLKNIEDIVFAGRAITTHSTNDDALLADLGLSMECRISTAVGYKYIERNVYDIRPGGDEEWVISIFRIPLDDDPSKYIETLYHQHGSQDIEVLNDLTSLPTHVREIICTYGGYFMHKDHAIGTNNYCIDEGYIDLALKYHSLETYECSEFE